MEIDRTGADGTSPRKRDAGLSVTRQKRPKNKDRGPHLAHKIIGRIDVCHIAGHRHSVTVTIHLKAMMPEKNAHRARIHKVGNIGQTQRPVGNKTCRHQGQRRILGAADDNIAVQRHSAVNLQPVHDPAPPRQPSPVQIVGHPTVRPSHYHLIVWPATAPCGDADWRAGPAQGAPPAYPFQSSIPVIHSSHPFRLSIACDTIRSPTLSPMPASPASPMLYARRLYHPKQMIRQWQMQARYPARINLPLPTCQPACRVLFMRFYTVKCLYGHIVAVERRL